MFGLLFAIGMFILIWVFFFGKVISTWGDPNNSPVALTGFESFMLANFNLWIFLVLIIFILAFTFIGGRQ